MATNHTQNYALNLWEPADKFVREEFNENNEKLEAALVNHDAALASKASTAALNALSQTVAQKGNCRIATGTYVGNDRYGENNPTVINLAALGAPPQVVIVGEQGESHSFMLLRGITERYFYNNDQVTVTWTATGVKLVSAEAAYGQMNRGAMTYQYIAIG